MTAQAAKELALLAVRPRTRLTELDVYLPCFNLVEAMLPDHVVHVVRRRVKLGDRYRVGMRLFQIVGICQGMDDQQHAQVDEILPWLSRRRSRR